MAWNAVAGAAINAGAGIIGNLIAGRQSRKNLEMQNAFNVEMWNAQNAYDHPAAQMERLREAGLNPNLVYGNGAVGNTSGPAPKSADTSQIKPYFDPATAVSSAITTYQDIQLRNAQIDNIKAQTDNIQARTNTESFRTSLTELQGKETYERTRQMEGLWNFNVQVKDAEAKQAALQVDKLWQELQNLGQDGINKSLETRYRQKQLTQMEIDTEIKQADLLWKQLENEWRKMGVTSSDNALVRVVVRMMHEAGIKDYEDIVRAAKGLFTF